MKDIESEINRKRGTEKGEGVRGREVQKLIERQRKIYLQTVFFNFLLSYFGLYSCVESVDLV